MGGYGSGRWRYHEKKVTVEECVTLDLAQLDRAGLFRRQQDSRVYGTLKWINPATQQDRSSISVVLERTDGDLFLTLSYRVQSDDIHTRIPILITNPYFGGVRYWGMCPDCCRRVIKLHVPPGGYRFSCRTCLGLSYRSVQEAHNIDNLRRAVERDMRRASGRL